MKKIIQLLPILFLLTLVTSCKKSVEPILGTWKVSAIDLGGAIPADQLDAFNKMIEESKDENTMTFKENGTFESKSQGATEGGESIINNGTYAMSEDGKTLTTITGESEEVMNVKSLTESELIVTVVSSSGEEMKMTLTK